MAKPARILERIERAGIVGMGGAGYPTHLKLRKVLTHSSRVIIGNGIECEPGVGADEALMVERPRDVVEGLQIVARCVNAEQTFIAMKSTHCYDAIHRVDAANINVRRLPSDPSQGEERTLVGRLTGRSIDRNCYPAEMGIVVLNVATLFAICIAVRDGQRPTSRLVSVNGEHRWVPFGTKLVKLADASKPLRLGGPVLGRPAGADSVTGPTSNAVFNVEVDQSMPCIRCSRCDDSCPTQVPVMQLLAETQSQHLKGEREPDLARCIECGACAVVCPSSIPLVDVLRQAMTVVNQSADTRSRADAAALRYERRRARLRATSQNTDADRDERLKQPRVW